MKGSPEELMAVVEEWERAAHEAGAPIAGYRSDLDIMRASYRDAGATPEQQGAFMMAAAIRGTLEQNPVVWFLLRDEILKTIVYTLAALK